MAKALNTRSDMLEKEFAAGATQLIYAGVLLLVFLLLLYLFHFVPIATVKQSLMILSGAGVLFALAYGGVAVYGMQKARTLPKVTFECPYCDFPMQFLKKPTEDFDCESCHRHVQFENGEPVPIKVITCTFCKTVHKVSSKARQYTCDRCNRALRLTDPSSQTAIVAENTDMLANYDVVLTDVGRQRNEVAMALESILICNLVEARRQMENLPLTVVRNVAERKADAVRRRLRDLGATAIVRQTETGTQARAARR